MGKIKASAKLLGIAVGVMAIKLAGRNRGRPEGASVQPSWSEVEDDAEGLRLAEAQGVSALRVTAYQSLARSRGLTLEQLLKACFRGELRDVVALPQARPLP
jgi:hypothetical protein